MAINSVENATDCRAVRQQQCNGQGADWSIGHDKAQWSEAKARRRWRECGIVQRWEFGGDDDFGSESGDGEEKEEEDGWEREGEGWTGTDGWRVLGFIVVWIFPFIFFALSGLGDSGSFRLATKARRELRRFCQETLVMFGMDRPGTIELVQLGRV